MHMIAHGAAPLLSCAVCHCSAQVASCLSALPLGSLRELLLSDCAMTHEVLQVGAAVRAWILGARMEAASTPCMVMTGLA